MTSHMTRLDRAASQFFVSQALVTRTVAGHGTFDYDMDGALAAGQFGVGFVSARSALHVALFMSLAREGQVDFMPVEMGHHVHELLHAHDPEGVVTKEAWRLECLNPTTPDEVRSYIEQCRRFFREVLHVSEYPTYGAMFSDAAYHRYLELAEELSNTFEHLGVKGINLPDCRRRIEQRKLVKRSVLGETVSRTGDERAGGMDAAATVQIRLKARDARAFMSLLRERVSDLTRQIPQTDGRDDRRSLVAHQELCQRVLDQCADACARSGG